ncbi:hypothetical protein AVEN_268865-1 [Araneus ventricosus]|uniref:DDE-1 domain-containing protein n=1 Tax=Araneus ventricosus TaxID=182803 RepID=A0A4Y2EY42_ARAVE|nr:hypothetical protein AVEN_268865-1 [Araneus ventricosus]
MVSFRIYSICKKTSHKSQKLPIKALLVLDNAPSHPSEKELKDSNIQAVFLTPNVTALIQPMDQGVIESVKRRYRRKLLTALSGEDGKNTSVIDLLKQINIKNVVYMMAESCSEIPESTLVKSWKKFEFGLQIKSVKKRRSFPQRYLQPTFYQHLNISMDVKTSMQKTWSNGWPLTRISSKRLCRMKTPSAPSQMGFKAMMVATTSLKIPHPSYLIRIEWKLYKRHYAMWSSSHQLPPLM